MSDAPETIWAQCSAHQNWDDLNASRHKVDWWHKYTRNDLCIPINDSALVALVEALRGIDVYLSDTLSGRVVPDPATYKDWLIDGIKEARTRARVALAARMEEGA